MLNTVTKLLKYWFHHIQQYLLHCYSFIQRLYLYGAFIIATWSIKNPCLNITATVAVAHTDFKLTFKFLCTVGLNTVIFPILQTTIEDNPIIPLVFGIFSVRCQWTFQRKLLIKRYTTNFNSTDNTNVAVVPSTTRFSDNRQR